MKIKQSDEQNKFEKQCKSEAKKMFARDFVEALATSR